MKQSKDDDLDQIAGKREQLEGNPATLQH